MKAFKLIVFIAAAIVLMVGFGSRSDAFHEGGVATCDGCHTMHNSSENSAMNKTSTGSVFGGSATIGKANIYLLQGADQSSTCLKCHSKSTKGSYTVASTPAPGMAPAQFTPGGDFAWLKKTTTYVSRGSSKTNEGRLHGHNIIAADFTFVADTKNAPGNDTLTAYSKDNLHCSSCHDPHGKYRIKSDGSFATTGEPIHASGSYGEEPVAGTGGASGEAVGVYRLLGGIDYKPKSYTLVPFANNPPVAVAPATYNNDESAGDYTVAYGKGMSEWCANCHKGLHNDTYATGQTAGNMRHPAGNAAKLGAMAANYTTYVMSGNVSNASTTTAYTTMVPFELNKGTADLAALQALTTMGAQSPIEASATDSNVSCLSCHRAHATAWASMSRWNNGAELLLAAGKYPGSDYTIPDPANPGQTLPDPAEYSTATGMHLGYTQAEVKASFYNRPESKYASFQRSLCNKCHAKD